MEHWGDVFFRLAVHHPARNGRGASIMSIAYRRTSYPKGLGDALPWFVSLGIISAVMGFASVTLLGLL